MLEFFLNFDTFPLIDSIKIVQVIKNIFFETGFVINIYIFFNFLFFHQMIALQKL